jgi:hypothetical protein
MIIHNSKISCNMWRVEEQAIINQAARAAERLAKELDHQRQELTRFPAGGELVAAAALSARRVLAGLKSSDERRMQ